MGTMSPTSSHNGSSRTFRASQGLGGKTGNAAYRSYPLSQSPAFYLVWGNFLFRRGRLEDARDRLLRCLQLSPDEGEARHNLAVVYSALGHPNEAARHLKELVSREPGNAKAALTLGVIQMNVHKDPAAALPNFKRLLKLAPHHPDAEQIRGAVAQIEAALGAQ